MVCVCVCVCVVWQLALSAASSASRTTHCQRLPTKPSSCTATDTTFPLRQLPTSEQLLVSWHRRLSRVPKMCSNCTIRSRICRDGLSDRQGRRVPLLLQDQVPKEPKTGPYLTLTSFSAFLLGTRYDKLLRNVTYGMPSLVSKCVYCFSSIYEHCRIRRYQHFVTCLRAATKTGAYGPRDLNAAL